MGAEGKHSFTGLRDIDGLPLQLRDGGREAKMWGVEGEFGRECFELGGGDEDGKATGGSEEANGQG